ncbi:hypothetical protein [Paenibacillus lutrae]|uniref:Uncharacterized protein n=1 Tax=Paenibacillus lutrae TaxID=2078573 RepID=A0A7X3FM25_9BACL|nr:hypothetical protein [Paenibacillus lutrae]MVP01984.1 hypothetical protein [Paenibacillus lutrae]
MTLIHHINYQNADNEVYCCLRNKVVRLDDYQKNTFCGGCKMFAGFAGGKGVECEWDDMREVSNPLIVRDPVKELFSNQVRKLELDDPSTMLFGS